MADLPSGLSDALRDRYTLERELGRGGMATVYLARDLKHGRPVALKTLLSQVASAVSGERFLREIRLTAQLDHPHIVPVLDSGAVGGFLWYTMPHVNGESLRHRLRREVWLSVEEAVRVARDVADALDYAHRHGIVHRDVKPENILLADGHARVADFGIATALETAGGENLTHTGVVVGTPAYMSPEQASGSPVDARSDIYALGCVLYEMLAGEPPYTGPTPQVVLAKHRVDPVPSIARVAGTTPPALDRAITRALDKVPAARFATAREFADELLQVASCEHPRTRRSSLIERTRPLGGPLGTRAASVRLWSASLAILLVFAGGWGLRHVVYRSARAGPAAVHDLDARRIAVLYFDQRSRQDSLRYFADGITEELIHELSGVPTLQVVSRNGVGPYRNTTVAPDSIARALKVGTLVAGMIDPTYDSLRLSVSLIDGATGTEIGSKSIERPREEIFALQRDLAREVSIFLRQRLGREVRLRDSQAGRHNARAWHLLLQAEELTKDVDPLLAAGDTGGAAGQLQRADSLLALAERTEPGWAKPIVSRGWLAYQRLDLVGTFDKSYYEHWTANGLARAERALRLEPDDPDALELRGTLRYYRWVLNLARDSAEASNFVGSAEADLQAAIAGNPTAAFALTVLSHLLMAQNRTPEAKLAALRAYQADPYLSSAKQTIWRLFQSSLDLEDRQEARRWCQEGQQRFPESYRFTECQIWLYALKGERPDINRVWRLYEHYLELTPPNARRFNEHYGQMLVAMALARAGLRDSANGVAVRARADSSLDPTRDLSMLEAIVRTVLGNRDEALDRLTIYFTANPQLRASMARDQTWWFKDLRDDPRYGALLAGTP